MGETRAAGVNGATERTSAFEVLARLHGGGSAQRPAVFLDYDGTLTPIVERPEDAVLSEEMRAAVRQLSGLCPVAVISGRDLADVKKLVGVEGIFYAGNHGFEIEGPEGESIEARQGEEFLPELDLMEQELKEALQGVAGALVERKRFSVAVHYRLVGERDLEHVERAVAGALARHPRFRESPGKKVHDLQPDIEWDKGKAVLWVLVALGLAGPDVLPVYIGDDITDEDAFRVLATRGVGVAVMEQPRPTEARYVLRDPAEVGRFLEALASALTP